MCSRLTRVAATIATLTALICPVSGFRAQDGGAHKAAGEGVTDVRARLARLQLIPSQRRRDVSSKLHLEALPVPRFASSQQAAKAESGTQGQLPRPRMAWEEVPGASGYEWQLWNGKSCRGYLVSAGTTHPTDTAAEATDFIRSLADGPYFWRVRALGDGIVSGASPWSCGAAFQIGPLGCSGQVLDAPSGLMADGQSCGPYIQTSDNHPILQWGAVSSASGYHYEVWTGIDCTGTLAASGTVDASTASASLSYLENGSYFWRVKALGDGSTYCDGPWSTTCSFTVGVPSCGGTYLSSPDITSLVEWDTSGSPYVISGQLLVDANGMLTIDAGVIVKFAPGASALVNGTLIINGTSSSRVVFGSLNDNTLCGPSPGGSGNPQPGDWSGVTAASTANLLGAYWTVRHANTGLSFNSVVGAVLDYLRVSFCQDGISLQYSTAAFTNTLVEWCSGTYGVDSDCLSDSSSFTNLDLYQAPLLIDGYSQATFTGGTWDGGGTLWSAGTLDYSQGTPDPAFEGITIQNMSPESVPGLAITGQVMGTTHWQGIPFWIQDGRIGSTGVVYASDTTLYSQGAGIDVQGQLYLGAAGTTTTARDFQGGWPGITYEAGSSGNVANATIENAYTGLAIYTVGSFSCSNTRIQSCQQWGVYIQAGGTHTFADLNLTSAPLYISGNCHPTFTGGTWDGGGTLWSAGTLDYSQGTPDPVFSNITIQNVDPSSPPALAVIGEVTGTTHWQGIPFWIQDGRIGSTGVVYASNTTLYSQGAGIDVQGQFYLGVAGTTTTARDVQGGWPGITYEAGSSGNVANATIENAYTGLAINTVGSFSCSNTLIQSCQQWGVYIQAGGTYTFANLNLTSAPLYISGNCHPTFTGGTWDGGGTLWSAGTLDYSQGTPDPVFSNITIQNVDPSSPPALAVIGEVTGTTHWQGIPFWIQDGRIGSTGVVYASNTTLYSQGTMIDVQGQFYLGAAGTTTTARDFQGIWQGIIYEGGASGTVTNTTIKNAWTGLSVSCCGSFVCTNTLIESCWNWGVDVSNPSPLYTYKFDGLSLYMAPLHIGANSHAIFTGGTWDGGGTMNIGTLDYSQGTPDPSFSNVTIQNPPPGNPTALAIQGQVNGTTHWKGIPFWIQDGQIGSLGVVYASNTTLYSQGTMIDVQGRLYLGQAGTTTTATDFQETGWPGIIYEAGSSGIVSNTMISRANQAITVATSGAVLLTNDVISSSQQGLVTQGDGEPLVERTTFSADNGVSVSVQGNTAPDLGGGALGSPGYNTLLGTTYAVQNLSASPVSARFNWWGCTTEAEMDAGLQNITAIYDHADDDSLGVVNHSGWLGSKNRVITVSRQNNDVLLTWPQEPTGTLTVFKGTSLSGMASVGTTTGASWRDLGALDDPSPLTFYRVDGPCP